jgi:hypothetical protein
MMVMELIIGHRGNLRIKRGDESKAVSCPFREDTPCGDWCALFGEPEDYGTALSVCLAKLRGKVEDLRNVLAPQRSAHVLKCAACGLRVTPQTYLQHFQQKHPEYKMVIEQVKPKGPYAINYLRTRYSCGVCGKGVPNYGELVRSHRHQAEGAK